MALTSSVPSKSNSYVAQRSRTPRNNHLGPYTPVDAVFPTVAVDAGNVATTLTGSPVTIYPSDSTRTLAGTWSAGTAYTAGQWVLYGASSVDWLAVGSSTGVAPGTDSSKWIPLPLDSRFSYLGAPPIAWRNVYAGQGAFHNGAYNAFQQPEASTQRNIIPTFNYVGSALEILLPGDSGKIRITVDGVADPAGWRALPSDNKEYRYKLTFAQVDQHVITVECATANFGGVCVGAGDVVSAVPLLYQPRCIVQGDSVTYGQNIETSKLETFPYQLGRMLGWDVWEHGQGGTGFINPGVLGGYTNYVNRIATDALWTPDVLIGAGGLNDQTTANAAYTTPANQTAITSWFNTARAALPRAILVVVGPFFTVDAATDATQYANIKAARDGQLAGAQAAGCTTYNSVGNCWLSPDRSMVYVDTIPGWLTGKYSIGGSANVLLSSDGIHPTSQGHRYYARRIAQALAAAIPSAGTL